MSKNSSISKSLKGSSIETNLANIDTLSVGTLNMSNSSLEQLLAGLTFDNVTITNSFIDSSIIGQSGPISSFFTDITSYGTVTFNSTDFTESLIWDPNDGTLNVNGQVNVTGCSQFGNINICVNTIRATNADGSVNIVSKGLGSIFLTGGINNTVVSQGSFLTNLANGGVTFLCSDNIILNSRKSGFSLNTGLDQSSSTINGDIIFSTDTGAVNKVANRIVDSSGTTVITCNTSSNLRLGDTVTLSATTTVPVIDGVYTVSSIINDTTFAINTVGLTQTGGGTFIKSLSNDIILNAGGYVKIPENIPITFGDTTNQVYHSTSGIHLVTSDDLMLEIKDILVPTSSRLIMGDSDLVYNTENNIVLNNNNSSGGIIVNSVLYQNNATNATFSDPVLSIGSTSGSGTADRGIEFWYTTNGNTKLGWFGYKTSTSRFTFLTDATNTNEVITGTPGDFNISSITVNQLTLSSLGNFNIACGTLTNVGLITGCAGTVNVHGTTSINISSGSRIAMLADQDILLPNGVPLIFGSGSGTEIRSTGNNLKLTGTQILLNSSDVLIPQGSLLHFNGTNANAVASYTSGALNVIVERINLSAGNVVLPNSTVLQFGSTENSISGSETTMSISTVNDLAVNASSIVVSTANTTILNDAPIIFNTDGPRVYSTSGNLVVSVNSTSKNIILRDVGQIYLSAESDVYIPTDVDLNFATDGSRRITGVSSGDLLLNNDTRDVIITSNRDTTIVSNNSANVSAIDINFSAASLNLDVSVVKLFDPILKLANGTTGSSDLRDRGIEFVYPTTSGSTALGWFGWKNSSGNFTFLSEATNTNEVISGTLGNIVFGRAQINGLVFNGSGNIDMSCGTISNLKTITGCTGTLDIVANNAVHISTGTVLLDTPVVKVPDNAMVFFGSTENSVSGSGSGTLTIKSGKIILDSDVQINGTTHNVYSIVTNLVDPIISLGGISGEFAVNDNKDRGVQFYWSSGVDPKVGFFGFRDSSRRLVYIPDGTNSSEVFSGALGDLEFNKGYFNNIDLNCGTISNVNALTACSSGALSISSVSGVNISTSNIELNKNTSIVFGPSGANLASNSQGDLLISSSSSSGGVLVSGSLSIPSSNQLYIGDNSLYQSQGNFVISNTSGDIQLVPELGTGGNIYIPLNNNLTFGTSGNNRIVSDGQSLDLFGYSGVNINTSTVTFGGNVNILGNINAFSNTVVSQDYIYPLGTSQVKVINSIVNSVTTGNVNITTTFPTYLSIGDTVVLENTNSVPALTGSYIISAIIDPTTIAVFAPSITAGNTGKLTGNITTDQNADVGIQVNYWSNTSGNGVTTGSQYYNTAFFGFLESNKRWIFYEKALISNAKNVTMGTMGTLQANTVLTENLGETRLIGAISTGSFGVVGTNFIIGGGSINNTPIGNVSPEYGRFSTLTSTVSSALKNVEFQDTLNYAIERITLTTGANTYTLNQDVITSMIFATGGNFVGYGTIGNGSNDGQLKKVVITNIDSGGSFILNFGLGLSTPNPLGGTPSIITFRRTGQSAELVWDLQKTKWVLTGGSGGYVS